MPHLKHVFQANDAQARIMRFPKNALEEEAATSIVWRMAKAINEARRWYLHDPQFQKWIEAAHTITPREMEWTERREAKHRKK